jgi:hypothetical protein
MRLRHLELFVIAALMGFQVASAAEKQTVTIAATLQPLPELPTKLPLSEAEARSVVKTVLSGVTPAADAVMLHAVTYLADKPAANRQDWYTVDLKATGPLEQIEAAGDFRAGDQYKR